MIVCCTSPLSDPSWEQLVSCREEILFSINMGWNYFEIFLSDRVSVFVCCYWLYFALLCFLELLDNKKYEGQILRADPAEVIIEKQEEK